MQRRISRKGAIELSMSTIVVVIIAVVLLSLGLLFVNKVFKTLDILTGDMYANAQRALERNVRSDQEFWVERFEFEMGVGESDVFSAGVQNLRGSGGIFSLRVSKNQDWFVLPDPVFVDAGEQKGLPFIVNIPKDVPKGTQVILTMDLIVDGQVYESESIAFQIK